MASNHNLTEQTHKLRHKPFDRTVVAELPLHTRYFSPVCSFSFAASLLDMCEHFYCNDEAQREWVKPFSFHSWWLVDGAEFNPPIFGL